MGYFNPITNIANYTVYSILPAHVVDNVLYEAFSFSVVRAYLDVLHGNTTIPLKKAIGDSFYALSPEDGIFVPYAEKTQDRTESKEALINYVPERNRFPYLSFVDVYHDRYDHALVKDAVVLIGSTATALHDEFTTPV